NMQSGAIKLYLTYRALHYRRAREALFRDGNYVPVEIAGSKADHVCAFLRIRNHDVALVVAPRLPVALTAGELHPPVGATVWADTRLILPDDLDIERFGNVLTGELIPVTMAGKQPTVLVADVLSVFPVGLCDGGVAAVEAEEDPEEEA
ncbi:MAG: hypothetical protein GYB67_04085, partial [Chloroflexi bacterium]|nr:hypothetical protein [Chloroflexota bacterium]